MDETHNGHDAPPKDETDASVEPNAKKPGKKSRMFKKAPGAPKRFRSAFIFFSQHRHKEIQESLAKEGGSKEKTTSVAKMVSEAWRKMDEEERSKWEDMARDDKERFEKEKAIYRGPWTVPIGHRKSKDPSAPKRPASAFLAFSNTRRGATKRENKDSSNAEISRILSKMWKEAPEEVRKKYCEEEARERERYKVRIADWRQNNESRKKARTEEADGSTSGGESFSGDRSLPQHNHVTTTHLEEDRQIRTCSRDAGKVDWAAPSPHERLAKGSAEPLIPILQSAGADGEAKPSDLIRQSRRQTEGIPWFPQHSYSNFGMAPHHLGAANTNFQHGLHGVHAVMQQQQELLNLQRMGGSTELETLLGGGGPLQPVPRFNTAGLNLLENLRARAGLFGQPHVQGEDAYAVDPGSLVGGPQRPTQHAGSTGIPTASQLGDEEDNNMSTSNSLFGNKNQYSHQLGATLSPGPSGLPVNNAALEAALLLDRRLKAQRWQMLQEVQASSAQGGDFLVSAARLGNPNGDNTGRKIEKEEY